MNRMRCQVEDKNHAIQEAKTRAVHLEEQLDQSKAESRHSREEAALELTKLRDAYEALQRSHVELFPVDYEETFFQRAVRGKDSLLSLMAAHLNSFGSRNAQAACQSKNKDLFIVVYWRM